MAGHLLLTCLLLFISISPSESSSYSDLIKHTRQVTTLHDMLKAEGCEYPIINGTQKRAIVEESDQQNYDMALEALTEIQSQMREVLEECRSDSSTNSTQSVSLNLTSILSTATNDTLDNTTSYLTTGSVPGENATQSVSLNLTSILSTATNDTLDNTTSYLTTGSVPRENATQSVSLNLTSISSTATNDTLDNTTSYLTTGSVPRECQSALNLTEGWRQDHNGSDIRPKNGNENCDTSGVMVIERPWFRFSGAAGNRLMNQCVPYTSCGTASPLWSDDAMPTQVGVITQANVYGSEPGNCRAWYYTKKISVVRCSSSPHDFVYRYDGGLVCYLGFCGMTA